MKTLFLAWQDPVSRAWFPIGRLIFDGNIYRFVYIRGVLEAQQKANFQSLWAFPELDKAYESLNLFPLFTNRLLRQSRPDYPDFVQWLNIPEHKDDPIALLARSGGKRATDTFEVFPYLEPDEQGYYHIHFFANGLRHLTAEAQSRIHQLQPGELLDIVHDRQNIYDSKALILRTKDLYIVGYCPRYLTNDIFDLIYKFPKKIKVLVERINLPPTPLQFRLMCNLTTEFSADFQPFSDPTYQPLVEG